MARDPELPRFGGLFSRLGYGRKPYTVLQAKVAHTVVPSQHLIHKVLHLVCEFRASRFVSDPNTKAAWIPACVGMTEKEKPESIDQSQ
jgi:hypothetical protein